MIWGDVMMTSSENELTFARKTSLFFLAVSLDESAVAVLVCSFLFLRYNTHGLKS